MFVQEPSTQSKQQHNIERLELKNCKFGFDFISKAFLYKCEYVPLRNLLIMHAAKNCLISVYCKGQMTINYFKELSAYIAVKCFLEKTWTD